MVWHHQHTNSTACPHVCVQGLQDQERTKNAFGTLQKTSRRSSPENLDIYQLNYTYWN